jgi:hypothetical protein
MLIIVMILHLPDFEQISTPKYIFDAQMIAGTARYWLVCSSGVGEARKRAVGHGSSGGVVVRCTCWNAGL